MPTCTDLAFPQTVTGENVKVPLSPPSYSSEHQLPFVCHTETNLAADVSLHFIAVYFGNLVPKQTNAPFHSLGYWCGS